jgi:hypothetical protein
MRYLIFGAIGMIMTAYGLSDGLAQLGGSPGRTVGWIGVAITAIAAYFQYRDALPFEMIFSEQSWKRHAEREHTLSVPSTHHKKGTKATAVMYQANDRGFEEVSCFIQTVEGGAVEAHSSKPFPGKIVIK